MTIRVGINGFGTIGKRVADAIGLQPDMTLVGIVKTKPDYKARIAIDKGYTIFTPSEKEVANFEKAGLKVSGTVADMLKNVDVVTDATPADVGKKYKPSYMKAEVKGIFQGGEEADVADLSFVAQCNFDKAEGRHYLRAVSCNTTGLCRTLNALDQNFGVKKACATIIRRATDPDDVKRGPINAIVPDPTKVPSHHGLDVNTVLPHIPITTMAVKVPTTFMHVHTVSATLRNRASQDDVIEVFENTTRVILVTGADGIQSTAQLFDYARDLGRPRNDLYEICVWRESVNVVEDEVYFMQAVDQEADVVPENIDAIRAITGLATAEKSMKTTNDSLHIIK